MLWYLWVSTVRGESPRVGGDLLHRASRGQEPHHVALARRQRAGPGRRRLRQRREDVVRQVGGDVAAARQHRVEGRDELLPGRVLDDEPRGARAEHLGGHVGVGMHGQDDHARGERRPP